MANKMDFRILCDGEEFPVENVTALENALQGFVKTDVTLAVELFHKIHSIAIFDVVKSAALLH